MAMIQVTPERLEADANELEYLTAWLSEIVGQIAEMADFPECPDLFNNLLRDATIKYHMLIEDMNEFAWFMRKVAEAICIPDYFLVDLEALL